MDECHVCGREAAGEGIVEGAKIFLCEDCARYSKNFKSFYARQSPKLVPKSFSKKVVSDSTELAEDYSKRIMQAREKKGWNREELGKHTAVTHQEIIGFEEGRLKPVENVAKKLEYALGIKLFEENADKELDLTSLARENATRKGEPSLADVVLIKKKK